MFSVKNKIYFTILFLLLTQITKSQISKQFKGEFEFEGKIGLAEFNYLTKNNEDLKQGLFNFKSKAGENGSINISGNFVNNEKTGIWNTNMSWTSYNGQESRMSFSVLSNANEHNPYEEITKKITTQYNNGQKEGKEITIYTTNSEWYYNGKRKKNTIYRKEKSWKNGILQDFSFETIVNGFKLRSIKGKYSVLEDTYAYDGDWVGNNDGLSFVLKYDKGIIKSIIKKNINTGKIIENSNYEIEKELINKYNDKNSIPVTYEKNRAKLYIIINDDNKYDFELLIPEYTPRLYINDIKSLETEINITESDSPIWNSPIDHEWIAWSNYGIKEKYITNNRENSELENIKVELSNTVKLFDIIDESKINYKGTLREFFRLTNRIDNWENKTPTYFSPDLYLQNLLYKGKADRILSLYNIPIMEQELKLLKRGINEIGEFPYYFLSLSLAGDTAKALEMIELNLNNSIKLNNGTELSWFKSIEDFLHNYIRIVEKSYPIERINFLKKFKTNYLLIRETKIKTYLDSLTTVKLGQLNWTNSNILPEKLEIPSTALLSWIEYHDGKIEIQKNAVIVLDYINKTDVTKFEPKGWRLPNLNELKDLFSSGLNLNKIKLTKLSMMDGDQFNEKIEHTEYRYLMKGEDGQLYVYNATTNKVITVNPGSTNKLSCLCILIKKN